MSNVVEALRAYQQGDADGVMVLVSRQACDEGAAEIERLRAELADRGAGPKAADYARDAFELLMTDAGKWPRAVERNSDGGYLLMQTASAWPIWCAAVAFERERCAKLCEGMHDEDRPSDYAWTIRTDFADEP